MDNVAAGRGITAFDLSQSRVNDFSSDLRDPRTFTSGLVDDYSELWQISEERGEMVDELLGMSAELVRQMEPGFVKDVACQIAGAAGTAYGIRDLGRNATSRASIALLAAGGLCLAAN